MIPQVTAAALVSENKQRSSPHLDDDRHLHPDMEKAIQLMRPAAAIAAVGGRLPGVVEGVR